MQEGRITILYIYSTKHMKLACKDITPTTTCTFEVEGAVATDVAKQMLAHARIEHADDIRSLSDEEVIKAFESKVRA